MGRNFDQILAEARQLGSNVEVGVSIVTNQDNGIVSYATGRLKYHPGSLIGPIQRPDRLSTTGSSPLLYYFSDRMIDIDPPDPPPSSGNFPSGHLPRQPFSANATDKLGVSISRGGATGLVTLVAKFTLHSWGNATFSVPVEARGNLLVGVGPPIGNLTDHAVYVISFNGPYRLPA
jgi:hypothetical protein